MRDRGTDGAEPEPGNAGHREYLDGLRGVAILLVLAVHVGLFVPDLPVPLAKLSFYGLHGVQLFFIVSGLTLMIAHRDRPWSAAGFAARRFFRVAPMFYLGGLLYWGLGHWLAPVFSPVRADATDVAATLLFLHGWLPHGINGIVPGGWSVAAEAMFYCLFPGLLALAGRPRLLSAALVVGVAAAGAAHFLLKRAFALDADADGFPFYFWVSQLPAFLIGCRIGAGRDLPRLSRGVARCLFGVAVAGMVVDSQWRGSTNLLVAVALLGLVAWTAEPAGWRWLSAPAATFLGRVSFSLYLLHFAVLGAVGPWVRAWPLPWWAEEPMLFALLLALALPLAWACHHGIERPGVALGRRLTRRAASGAAPAAASVVHAPAICNDRTDVQGSS